MAVDPGVAWPLVKPSGRMYRPFMLKRYALVTALLCTPLARVGADVVQLKGNASVTGQILLEKPDQIVVDIGYTALVIPRGQVIDLTKGDEEHAEKPVAQISARENIYRVPAGTLPERSVRELVNQLGESVVQVRTPGGLGSGFFINEDGYLITNFHVIEGETQISVEVYAQRGGQLERHSYKQVRIIAMNKFADLTLLKVEDSGAPKFAPVVLGESDSMAVGDHVFAIGSPLGLERTVTEGILSTKTREMQGELYLQTTAQINPGNSGGPLFNLKGEVIGVTNMKMTFSEGLGFAIPVEAVKYFLDHRDAFAYDNDNPSNPYRYLEPPSRTRHTGRDAKLER